MDTQGPAPKINDAIDVRTASLLVLAIVSIVYSLRAAQAVFIPLTIAIVTACALAPAVAWLQRKTRIPKPVGAAVTLLVLCALLGVGANSLQPQLLHVLDVVPRATAKFSDAMRASARNHNSALQKLNRAAAEIERAAVVANAPSAAPVRPAVRTPSEPAEPPINVRDYIMMGTANAVAAVGQLVVVLSLVYFMLISGDTFRFALVNACGNNLARRKTALRIMAQMRKQIQRYLAIQLATSALLGGVVGAVFAGLGLENAFFWGCCGALLHLIPYVGPAVFVVVVSMVAYVQFHTWMPVAAVISSILLSSTVIGMLLVPWLTQRVGRLNAVTVFVTLLFWGWLWGTWGLLLGIPIVMALSVICEQVPGLQPISHFLSTMPAKRQRGSSMKRRLEPSSDTRPVPAESR